MQQSCIIIAFILELSEVGPAAKVLSSRRSRLNRGSTARIVEGLEKGPFSTESCLKAAFFSSARKKHGTFAAKNAQLGSPAPTSFAPVLFAVQNYFHTIV